MLGQTSRAQRSPHWRVACLYSLTLCSRISCFVFVLMFQCCKAGEGHQDQARSPTRTLHWLVGPATGKLQWRGLEYVMASFVGNCWNSCVGKTCLFWGQPSTQMQSKTFWHLRDKKDKLIKTYVKCTKIDVGLNSLVSRARWDVCFLRYRKLHI